MADPNRPVTGYPAPNPNPNPNGYSSGNPPPSGTAYPYPAAAQHPPYYAAQNPYYYQHDPDSVRRATCLRRIFALVIALIVIFGTITFIVWLVLRPQLPEFRVDSLSVSNFSVSNNSLASFTAEFRLTARNPNKKMSLKYDHIEAFLFYRNANLADTMIPPFSQGTRNETGVKGSFASAGNYVDDWVVRGINDERAKSGNVGFNLRVIARVKYEAKAWRTRRRLLKVLCDKLNVGLSNNAQSGTLIAGPKQCRAGV